MARYATARSAIEKYWRPDIALFVGAMLVGAFILYVNYLTLSEMREDTVRSVEANLKGQAVLLAGEGDRSLKILDAALTNIADDIAQAGLADGGALGQRLAGHEIHEWLRNKIAGVPYADAIALVGADGKLVNLSRSWPIPSIDVGDRDYVRVLKADAAPKAFVSKPVQDASTGRWTINLARRLSAANGDLAGFVVGSVAVEHFESFFQSVAVPDGMAIVLARDDGVVLAQYPRGSQIGKVAPAAAARSDRIFDPRLVTNPADVQTRVTSTAPLAGYPLIIALSQAEDSALRSWHKLAERSTSMALARIAVVLLMALMATRWWGKQRRLTKELRLQNMRFDTALDNMGSGLCMFDADKRLVVCNERYVRLYRLPPELSKPGTSHAATIAHCVEQGVFKAGNGAGSAQQRLSESGTWPAEAVIEELADGRLIRVTHQPMAEGGWVATHEDVTERHQSEAKVAHMARHDVLTGLPNRAVLRERLDQAIKGTRDGARQFVVHALDLDRFKEVNDALGHPVGDSLLKAVALRLRGCVRDSDTLARVGGDELCIIQCVSEPVSEAAALAERIIETISGPFDLGDHHVTIGVSIGMAVAPTDGESPDRLLRSADLALYRAKSEGRNTYCFFEHEMDVRMQKRRALESDLRSALANDGLEVYYQPIVNLERNEICAMEALLRWNHRELGNIPPADFIPIAEETGLIIPIGEWVLRRACSDAAAWPKHVRVAVNLSAAQFKSRTLLHAVVGALGRGQIGAHRLELEITESVMLDAEGAFATLQQLRDLGVRIALDDFGTGYSSLSNLRRFPFDKIKIDRSFISDLSGANANAVALVRSMARLGVSLGMSTTAEGVETKEQLDGVRAYGCTEIQGYHVCRPVPAREIAQLFGTASTGEMAGAA